MEAKNYISPDRKLVFKVLHHDDGDVSLGFEGTPWHTHGDVVAAEAGLPIEKAVAGFIEALFSDKLVVCISSTDGVIRDIWVTNEPQEELRYKEDRGSLEFRYWSGVRLVARVIATPIRPTVRHYSGIPPELSPSESRMELPRSEALTIEVANDGVFLYRFGADGTVVGEAKQQAEYEFGNGLSDWLPLPGIADPVAFALEYCGR